MEQNINNQTPTPAPPHDVSASQTAGTETHNPKPKRQIPWLKIVVFGLVGIISLAAFGLIAYLMMGEQATNEEADEIVAETPIEQEADPTADWEMYTGDEFSFKIPPGWATTEAFDPESSPNLSLNLAITKSNDNESRTPIVVMRYENPNNLSVDKWQEEYNKNRPRSRTFWQPSDTESELSGLTIYQSNEAACEPFLCYQTLVMTDGYVYQIYAVIDNLTYADAELVDNKIVYDQILSTFKFQDSESAAQKYLEIPELGVKIPLSSATNDAYYEIKTLNDSNVAYIKVHSLDQEPYCNDDSSGLAALTKIEKYDGEHLRFDSWTKLTSNNIGTLIGNNYYFIELGQAVCSQNAENQTIESNARKAFRDASINIVKI